MVWKFYVHYEADIQLEHTAIVHCEPEDPVSRIVDLFLASVRIKFPNIKVNIEDYILCGPSGKPLKQSKKGNSISASSLNSKDDLFIIQKEKEVISTKEPTFEEKERAEVLKGEGNQHMAAQRFQEAIEKYSAAIKLTPNNAVYLSNRAQAYLNTLQYMDALQDAKKAIDIDPKFVKSYLRAGKAAQELEQFGAAKRFFLQGMKVSDRLNDKKNRSLVKEFKKLNEQCPQEKPTEKKMENSAAALSAKDKDVLASIQSNIASMKSAFDKGKLKEAAECAGKVLEIVPGEKVSSHYLATILMSSERYKEVVSILTPAVKQFPDELELRVNLADACFELGDYATALDLLSKTKDLSNDPVAKHRITIRVARNLLKTNQEETASQLIMSILQKDENNVEALLEYAALLQSRAILDETIKVLLRCIILQSTNKIARRRLAQAVSLPSGLEILRVELKEANSPSALAFLALIFKDFGAISEASHLLADAAAGLPDNATYTLNYIHILEIQLEYQSAVEHLCAFLVANRTKGLPLLSGDGMLTCGDILDTMGPLENVWDVLRIQEKKTSTTEPVQSLSKVLNTEKKEKIAHGFTAEELDLLALFFTLSKILFVTGHLGVVHRLVAQIERVREGKELHVTTIRNEHAYYCSVAQLLEYLSLPLPPHRPLYVIGDSHTLSASFHTLTIRNEKRVTIPKLVTGCKMWHLRPDAYFFPKDNFWNAVRTIPEGSETVFLFGEIDCREGILLAVEKCRYDSIEEGIEHTVRIYLNALRDVKKEKKLDIYIHPIIPVLNETRSMVKRFNVILEKRVKETEKSSSPFYWLDFFPSLLTEDGSSLQSQFELDGTHLNPSYLPLLENAFNKVTK